VAALKRAIKLFSLFAGPVIVAVFIIFCLVNKIGNACL
jgi:hypothetical protein